LKQRLALVDQGFVLEMKEEKVERDREEKQIDL
jgi:hypothetical protein